MSMLKTGLLIMFWGFIATSVEVRASEVAPANSSANLSVSSPSKISGVPRLIRSQPETEVFFRDLNQSYIIPKDSRHNQIFEAVSKAMKKNSKVSFEVDPKSRQILGLDEASSAEKLKSAPDVLEKSP